MTTNNSPFGAGLAIYEVSRMIRRHFDRQARGLGFNTGQWRTLWHLERNPGITQAALAEILEMQPISLMAVLDKLQGAGLIEKRPHPTDGRAVQLFLTSSAKPTLEKLWAVGVRTRDLAMAGISADEQQLLHTVLDRMKRNLCTAADDPETAAPQENVRPLAAAGRHK